MFFYCRIENRRTNDYKTFVIPKKIKFVPDVSKSLMFISIECPLLITILNFMLRPSFLKFVDFIRSRLVNKKQYI